MSIPDPAPVARPRRRRLLWAVVAGVLLLLLFLVVLLAAFPVSLLRGPVERRLSRALKTEVHVGSVARDSVFSFTPIVSIRDVRVAQPAWVGQGDFIVVESASVRVPVLKVLLGRFNPDRVTIDGARIALVRNAEGRANWKPDKQTASDEDAKGGGIGLSDLTVTNSVVVLRDAKRGLTVAGPLSVDSTRGLRYRGTGTFLSTPATLAIAGGRIVGIDPDAAYPIVATIDSPALQFSAKGIMQGVLDTRHMTAAITARAPTLENLDRIIEAGMFGTQPIALTGTVRHEGRDWFVDRLDGSIGRSRFSGRASVIKKGIRTAIDAKIHATQFDFDDLADDEGQAKAAARRASIGERVIPPTRINLDKLWKTDGTITFSTDRLLSKGGTVFRSLSGRVSLDHRVVTATNLVARLDRGRMTGSAKIDHRSGLPKLSLDLRFDGITLEALVQKPAVISGHVRGRIVLAGTGETVREALAHASGKAALVATQGEVKRTVADVLGQNLSGALGTVIAHPSEKVPLRCLIADFRGTRGVLVPRPLEIDTGVSVGRGSGQIRLDGETIALQISGASKSRALLRIADPITIGGTLSSPSVTVAGIGSAEKPNAGSVLKVLGRSLGQALGLTKTPPSAGGIPPATFACAPAVAAALR